MPSQRLVQRLNKVAGQLTKGVERLIGEIGEEIGRDLVPATPVATGYARGNWRPSLNAPATVPVTLNDPSGEATVARISTVARQYQIGNVFYIVNNAPYITRLNQGASPQAPAGFVQAAVRSGTARVVARFSQGGLLSGN